MEINEKIIDRIQEIIMKIETPFSVSELYEIMEEEGILDKDLILDVLGELQESKLITPISCCKLENIKQIEKEKNMIKLYGGKNQTVKNDYPQFGDRKVLVTMVNPITGLLVAPPSLSIMGEYPQWFIDKYNLVTIEKQKQKLQLQKA